MAFADIGKTAFLFDKIPPNRFSITVHNDTSVADPDPGSGAFFTQGSWNPDFLGLKYLNSLMRIRDPRWKKFGSVMGKIRTRDPG